VFTAVFTSLPHSFPASKIGCIGAGWNCCDSVLLVADREHSSAIFDCSGRIWIVSDESLPEFAFIGRSNVGKSSLLNLLSGKIWIWPGFRPIAWVYQAHQHLHDDRNLAAG